jgi:spore coat protein U-like protein
MTCRAASRRTIALLAAGVAFLATAARPAVAQTNATMTVTATVYQPLTVSKARDLAFGNVFPGVTKTIPVTDGTNAGKITVAGQSLANVQVKVTAPASLAGPGPAIPVTWSGYVNTADNASTGGAPLTIVSGVNTTTVQLSANPVGQLYVFIAGAITPTSQQTAGAYSATLSVDVTYTGT